MKHTLLCLTVGKSFSVNLPRNKCHGLMLRDVVVCF